MDKTAFKIIYSRDDLDEIDYWLDKSAEERIEAIEFLRQQFISMYKLNPRMDKTIAIINPGK